jgi:hypothetical protein
MKNGASLKELTRERLARRLAAGHGAECDTCPTVFTVDEPGRLCRNGWWQCEECEPTPPPEMSERDDGYPEYDSSQAGWRNCSWCGVARHYSSGAPNRHSCTDYCSIRRSRHGGLGQNPWDTNTAHDESQCRHCGDTFYPRRKSAKFCGSTCRQASRRSKHSWCVHVKSESHLIGPYPAPAHDYMTDAFTMREPVERAHAEISSRMTASAKQYPHQWSAEVIPATE